MDKQTGKLIARIAENLPDMESAIMQGWIEDPNALQQALKWALCPREDQRLVTPTSIVPLTVDYGMDLTDMITAGRYSMDTGITAKHFPITGGEGKIEFEARLFQFDRPISSEDAKRLIEEAGWRVAKIEHLLSYGAQYPQEQCKDPIIGLGSTARPGGGRRVVQRLDVRFIGDSQRRLWLVPWRAEWHTCIRFLAIREKPQASTS